MRRRHALLGIVAAWSCTPSDAVAADKTSLACIQASDEGQTARENGNLLLARELFAQCTESKCPALIRRDCTSWLEQAQLQIPSVVFGARDAEGRDLLDAKVIIDGQPLDEKVHGGPVELNPGPHVIRWERAGDEPTEMHVVLRSQEKNRNVVATFSHSTSTGAPPASEKTTEATPPKGGLPTATYVLGGVGIAALGAFAYFGLRARHDSDSLHDTCAPGCAHSDVTALKTKLILADVALGVGTVSLVVAAIIAISGKSHAPKSAWDLRMAPTAGGARTQVEIRF
jgi:hypothetical protein